MNHKAEMFCILACFVALALFFIIRAARKKAQ